MDESIVRRRWVGRLTFTFLGLGVIFSHLIPLETVPPSFGGQALIPNDDVVSITADAIAPAPEVFSTPVRWIAPDLLLLLILAWVARRPSFAPVVVIAAVTLLSDLMFQRPPGLWAALVLILSEILRSRARSMRTLPFMLEWITVGSGITLITLIYHFTLSMLLVAQPSLGLTLIQMILTILAYPAVVFVSYAVFGVSRPAPGAVDELGHRL
ncbi:hypothetical protein [Pseudooctadecabacter jejudonensis]|uniref:Rod shape-determining protein MreD n=1 Tax=Pseudooctadecabacter jejudonensis TaxID=1391910 RepID=A0A1Y5SSU7_9RHOB|nr:hypothetical protein [Pseudooctadecabacter jejudonensis]SLN46991.1 hypothetical protein PSJ8397_02458 [Pseudooctadecabacter jejudonensis]